VVTDRRLRPFGKVSGPLAINPPSDIVLGVANAADPQKLRAAAAQLALAQGNAAGAANAGLAGAGNDAASALFASAAPKAQPGFDPQTQAAAMLAAATPAHGGATKRTPDVYTKFEAFLVQTFVESMLPEDAPDVYGSGIAGKIWKSMLAEHLANEMAKSTSFGIAERIAKHREGARPETSGAVNRAGASAAASPPALYEAAASARRGLG
jgi:flagellar protein FlgJ